MGKNFSLSALRALATFCVVWHHMGNGELGGRVKTYSYYAGRVFTYTCNYIFALISSYFGCKSTFNPSKALPIIIQTNIIGIYGYLFMLYYRNENFNIDIFLSRSNIFSNGYYWFCGSFVFARIFFSYVFESLMKYKKSSVLNLAILTLILYFCSFGGYFELFLLKQSFTWMFFVLPFLIGASFRIYEFHTNLFVGLLIFLVIFWINIQLFVNIDMYFQRNSFLNNILRIQHTGSPMIGLLSFSIFNVFLNFNMKKHFIVDILERHSLGIYLIHYNIDVKDVWKNIYLRGIYRTPKKEYFILDLTLKIIFWSTLTDFVLMKTTNILIFQRGYYKLLVDKLDNSFKQN
jgi:hypothetical protein